MKKIMKALALASAMLPLCAGAQTEDTMYVVKKFSVAAYPVKDVDRVVYSKNDAFPSYTSCPDDHHPHAIDLGLPSGTKWACCNVGASKPTEDGTYFAWGETTGGKITYTWSNYTWTTDGGKSFTKYTLDGTTTLEAADDAATQNWGEACRMPTVAQFQELIDQGTGTFTTVDGVNGYKFTSQKNSASVFFPASGWITENSVNKGSSGRYWSDSLSSSNVMGALNLAFGSSELKSNDLSARHTGFPVRPVVK